jgi:hypothetical protein
MLENMILIYHRTCLLHPACSFSPFVIFAILWLGLADKMPRQIKTMKSDDHTRKIIKKKHVPPSKFPTKVSKLILSPVSRKRKTCKSTTEIVYNVVLPCYVCWITTFKLQDYTIRYIYNYIIYIILYNTF